MKYHDIDSSPFGVRVKLCFDQDGADAILIDHDIDFEINAFDLGVAETHYISDTVEGIIVVIIDPAKCEKDHHFACGVVAHEAYHVVCRIFQHIGQPLYDAGEEVFAYTIEHIVKQMSAALEAEINARKASRSVLKQARKSKRGAVIQMDQQCDGSAGSDSSVKQSGVVHRTEDNYWMLVGTPEAGIQSDQPTGSGSVCTAK